MTQDLSSDGKIRLGITASNSNWTGGTNAISAVETVGTDINPGGWGGATIGVAAYYARISVTGKAATTINWQAHITGYQVGGNT